MKCSRASELVKSKVMISWQSRGLRRKKKQNYRNEKKEKNSRKQDLLRNLRIVT